ncbi:hypothetical protein SESBI_31556 [Sesbania bispinosa]|nr:hypothetical protein SESBI_31556 [Sesbania bispinosa]
MRVALDHYSRVFKSDGVLGVNDCTNLAPKLVGDELNQKLGAVVSDEEIRKVVDSLGSLKAPGPDDFNGPFYKSHRDVIKGEVCVVVRRFFTDEVLHPEVNETVLAPVPKIQNPESIMQYRSIS